MRKNRKKYFIMIVILIMIAVLIALIPTLSKYLTTTDGEATINIARWEIKVNEQSIKENLDISNVLVPVFEHNDNIANNVIAPNAKGSLEIDLDFTNADVSCDYVITIRSTTVSDLIVSDYSFTNNGTTTNVDIAPVNGNTVQIVNKYNYGSADPIFKYEIHVEWNDDVDTQHMNNTADTNATYHEATETNAKTAMSVNIAFTQSAS
jgi:flagellar basal body-associated protein FliL